MLRFILIDHFGKHCFCDRIINRENPVLNCSIQLKGHKAICTKMLAQSRYEDSTPPHTTKPLKVSLRTNAALVEAISKTLTLTKGMKLFELHSVMQEVSRTLADTLF